MRKSVLMVVLGLCFMGSLVASTVARADIIATLTADNHYGLYVGNADGSVLSFIGRNEKGDNGAGGYNWSLPETYSFSASSGSYIYVLAWNDGGPRSWIGQFTTSGSQALLSNTTQWQYTVASGPNPGTYGDVPALGTVQSDIAGAQWATPLASAINGTSPWGTIPDIAGSAQFIWSDNFSNGSSTDGHYVVFRAGAPVPVPPSLLLLAPGLAGLAVIRRRSGK
jgi:hypothetical protein